MIQRVAVVIPNWNGREHLSECLVALDRQTFRSFRIVVVDNGSSDASVEWLATSAPSVQVVSLEVNAGFAAAVNVGIGTSGEEFVALLNNDTSVDPHWLEQLVEALDLNHGYDFAASLMLYYDRPEIVNAAGDVWRCRDAVGANRGQSESRSAFQQPVRVLGASAGAALYRRSLFEDIGMFDEDFFLIHEDTDFNLRALIAGKRCVYVPTAVVRHKTSATIRTAPTEKIVRSDRTNRGIVIAKDLPLQVLVPSLLLRLWLTMRAAFPVRPALWGSVPRLARAALSGYGYELRGYRIGLRKRPEVWRRQAVPTREIIRWLRNGVGPL